MLWEKLNLKDTELWDIDVSSKDNSQKLNSINNEKNELIGIVKRKDIEIQQLKKWLLELDWEPMPSQDMRTHPLWKSN